MTKTLSLLVVEDDTPTRTLLEAVAHRNHFRAVACGDGLEALNCIGREDFAVILLDMRLPEVDGFELLERLAGTAPHLLARIIVVTAVAHAELRACAEIARVWRVLRKPFELRTLEEHILACAEGISH